MEFPGWKLEGGSSMVEVPRAVVVGANVPGRSPKGGRNDDGEADEELA